jgi:23S rRNA (cytidine1920-2'-O)/16S rRNA (cytidine1409-2'-O)-methyltransferase
LSKERLDVILVKKGFFETREKAKSAIMAGDVYIANQKADKPGTNYPDDVQIEIKENNNPFVSRGGLKIEKAIKEFDINLSDKVVIDVGASTGGFTDCMLMNGAKKVYAIDVGYGQLAWKLRKDEKVVCMERTNIRYVKPADIAEPADFASIDVSFISLKKVLPAVYNLLHENGEILCLVKPQFEAGRENVGKHGVVRDAETHVSVLKDIVLFAKNNDFSVKKLGFSPIKGPQGNIEFLLYLSKAKTETKDYNHIIRELINSAHKDLD